MELQTLNDFLAERTRFMIYRWKKNFLIQADLRAYNKENIDAAIQVAGGGYPSKYEVDGRVIYHVKFTGRYLRSVVGFIHGNKFQPEQTQIAMAFLKTKEWGGYSQAVLQEREEYMIRLAALNAEYFGKLNQRIWHYWNEEAFARIRMDKLLSPSPKKEPRPVKAQGEDPPPRPNKITADIREILKPGEKYPYRELVKAMAKWQKTSEKTAKRIITENIRENRIEHIGKERSKNSYYRIPPPVAEYWIEITAGMGLEADGQTPILQGLNEVVAKGKSFIPK